MYVCNIWSVCSSVKLSIISKTHIYIKVIIYNFTFLDNLCNYLDFELEIFPGAGTDIKRGGKFKYIKNQRKTFLKNTFLSEFRKTYREKIKLTKK